MVEKGMQRQVIAWLASGCILIFIMVLVGGITRLTGSGLSITEWKLITGTIPPLDDAAWEESFEAYKKYPQYEVQPVGFSLVDFKSIYWWEYIHRLLGRIIGLVFALPFIYFLFKKAFDRRFTMKLLFLFALGALQGFLGWYMVKSGLADEPRVSHYRLAMHLVLAFTTCAYAFWLILEMIIPQKKEKSELRSFTLLFLTVLGLQIIYGAFTAGMKAGLFYNTFPLMGESYVGDGAFTMVPFYLNFFESIGGVQFMHRNLGYLVFVLSLLGMFYAVKLPNTSLLRKTYLYIATFTFLQVLLGVFTLLYKLPLSLALMHQSVAFLILICLILALRLSSHEVSWKVSGAID